MAYSSWVLKESDTTELARVTPLRLPQWHSSKESPCNAGDAGSIPGLGRFPWRRKWQSTPAFLPGKSHGQRSLAGYSPWVAKEWGLTERPTLSLSDINKSPHPSRGPTAVVLEAEALLNLWRILRLFQSERQQEETPEETREWATGQSFSASCSVGNIPGSLAASDSTLPQASETISR